VRIGPTLAIPELLRSLGADPVKVITESGLDPAVFASPDNRITFAARGRLLRQCAVSTGCAHFGLLVGQTGGLSGFGMVGLLARYSADVGSALRSIVRFLHLHVHGATTVLEVYGDRAVLSYRIYEPGVEGTDQLGDGAVVVMSNVMRELCGPDWKPAGALFAHRRPDSIRPYQKALQAPLVFNAEQYAIVFASSWLSRAMPQVDPQLRQLLRQQIEALEARHGDDFAAQVRGVLSSALLTGRAGEAEVAAIFSMQPRTMSRRLAADGTSFRKLVDECSFEIARHLLEFSRQDVAQITAALDYADPSAFTRAFRRWSGTTPARWRASRAS
jgi:AraC-like DNA-binding protein